MYDIRTAEPCLRGGKKQPRPVGTPTPCGQCPKGSPAREPELTFNAESLATLALYSISQSTFGRGLTEAEANDPWLQRKLAIIHMLHESYERSVSSQQMMAVASMMAVRK